jgi:hypothetical protein
MCDEITLDIILKSKFADDGRHGSKLKLRKMSKATAQAELGVFGEEYMYQSNTSICTYISMRFSHCLPSNTLYSSKYHGTIMCLCGTQCLKGNARN